MFVNHRKIFRSFLGTLSPFVPAALIGSTLAFTLAVISFPSPKSMSLKDLSLGLVDLSQEPNDGNLGSNDLLNSNYSDSSAVDTSKTREEIFASEILRLKKYESQIQERVRSLDIILSEVDKLENGSADQWADVSDAKHTSRFRQSRVGIGGGDRSKSPVIHSEGAPTAKAATAKESAKNEKTGSSEEKVSVLLNDLDSRLSKLSSIPLGAPVITDVTSGYGWRVSPFASNSHFHTGVDFSIEQMTPVVATADGFVVNAGPKGSYGRAVIIQHQGRFETLYGHLAKVGVQPGEKVCRGERIGWVGSSGRSTGPHLHYEVRKNGSARDPVPYIELASFAALLQESDS